jgi:shikimate kinase
MCSGKSTLGNMLCQRTNAKMINFGKFVAEKSLESADDDEQCLALI